MAAPALNGRLCLLCGRRGPFTPVFAFRGHQLVRCPGCGLQFQDPQPDEATLDAAYYHDERFAEALLNAYREQTVARAGQKLSLLREAVPGLAAPRVLDVGCSSGAWLEVAAGQGWPATGVEIGAQVAAEARERGLDVVTGTLAEALPELAPDYDLVTFWDVLEHLRDPTAELGMAVERLAPGGLLAATFPNVAGWYPRLTYRLFARRLGVWEFPELPVHLYDFTPATARRMFEQAGLDVVAVRTFPLPFDFYRATSLSERRLGTGRRGRAALLAFDLLHRIVYPLARLAGRSNQMMIVGRRRG